MTSLDFAPAPGAAPATTRIVRHALIEAKLLVRNGEQLLIALVIPLGLLLAGRALGGRLGTLATLTPSVLAIAVWSSTFASVAIATGFERRYGVLERLSATPLGRTGLLAGKALAVTMIALGQLLVLGAAGLAVGWRPNPTPASAVLGLLVIGLAGATFVNLALLLAGRLSAEATLALANLIFVVLVIAGGLALPIDYFPGFLPPVIELLPTAALGDGLREATAGVLPIRPLLVLVVWCAVAWVAARKGFRWMS